jgi:porin
LEHHPAIRFRAGQAWHAANAIVAVLLLATCPLAADPARAQSSEPALPGAAPAATPAAGADQPAGPAASNPPTQAPSDPCAPPPPEQSGLWQRSNLLGDLGGVRSGLCSQGITFGLQEISEVLGNVTGGTRRGADYDGMTEMSVGIDTGKFWAGGILNITAMQIHGRNLSTDNLATLQTASGIEADRATRLWELWYQQMFLDGRADLKLGQQSIDLEFMTSKGASIFINTAMGWPVLPTQDLYAGGPSYPLSSLGVRLRVRPTDALTLQTGVFDDNPPGGAFNNDSQLLGAEAAGAAFSLRTGALWITEMQYAINQPTGAAPSQDGQSSGLPGTYKLGFWYDTGEFPDQQFDTAGVSLASPASNGMPRMHSGNYSVYAVADQMVSPGDAKGAQAVGLFARLMAAPPDRNLISLSADAGLTVAAPLSVPGHDNANDMFGAGFGVAQVSDNAAALDRDTAFFTGVPVPVRGTETFIEVTYQYYVAPWWVLQPDFQYVIMPGGGLQNPSDPPKRIGNEIVLGLRTTITF